MTLTDARKFRQHLLAQLHQARHAADYMMSLGLPVKVSWTIRLARVLGALAWVYIAIKPWKHRFSWEGSD